MSENKTTIDATEAMNALLAEESLRLGDNVTVTYNPAFPTDSIITPVGFNMRVEPGMVVGGVLVTNDTRNIMGMVADVERVGGVTEPLAVIERVNGDTILAKGYRRFGATQFIRKHKAGTPLAARLTTLPVLVYRGLTAEQERNLVNDQTSKRFSASDVFLYFKRELDGGFGWENICARIYPQIADVTGATDKVAKIDNMAEGDEKRKALKDWLTSYAYQFWYQACKNGAECFNLTAQTLLWQGGNIKTRPRVVMDSMRMKAVYSAILKDKNASEFDMVTGQGPRMMEVLKKYEDADAKAYTADGKKVKTKDDGPKFRKFDEFNEIIKSEESVNPRSLLAAVLKVAFKDGGNTAAFGSVRNFDNCRQAFTTHRDYLNPALREVLALVFDGSPADDKFTDVLVQNYVTPPTATPTNEQEVALAPEPIATETAPQQPEVDTEEYSLTDAAKDIPQVAEQVTDKPHGKRGKHAAKKA